MCGRAGVLNRREAEISEVNCRSASYNDINSNNLLFDTANLRPQALVRKDSPSSWFPSGTAMLGGTAGGVTLAASADCDSDAVKATARAVVHAIDSTRRVV